VVTKRRKADERGAVALITAMIVSILLLITTSGMVALTLKSLKGSSDGAQSTKAYYAAEGGLEEALLKIRNGQPADDCAGSANTPQAAKDGVVTCTKVTTETNNIVGTVGADSSVQIDLSAVANVRAIQIEWGVPENVTYSSTSIPLYLDGAGNSQFPKRDATVWPNTAPAVVEMGIVEFPPGDLSIGDVIYKQATLTPKSAKAGDRTANFNGGGVADYTRSADFSKPTVTPCRQTGTYQCLAAVGNVNTGKRYMLRLKTRYNGMQYRISVVDVNNKPLTIPGAVYTVDVTARAGDTFRRVKTSFPVNGASSPTSTDGLDYVLYSDTNICKAFEIKGGNATGINGCQSPF